MKGKAGPPGKKSEWREGFGIATEVGRELGIRGGGADGVLLLVLFRFGVKTRDKASCSA